MQEKTSGLRQVKVRHKQQEAENISSFELVSLTGKPLPAFTAGAHIDVHINGFIRQYSLCNDPHDEDIYRIAVLRDEPSRGGSHAMHDALHDGDILHISDPRNHFSLSPGHQHSVLMAGGIGITPLLSMAHTLHRSGASFELHYCTRSRERTAYLEALAAWPFADRVFIHRDDGEPEQKLDLERLLSDTPADSHWYVCGPSGFLDSVLSRARAAGIPDAQLHREYFSASTAPGLTADNDASGAFDVIIASSNQSYTIEKDESVAQGLLRQGVEIMVSCEQGVCGTCLTKVLSGVPEHRDLVLTPDEQARNDIFAPCCSRAKSACLVLDL